MVHIGGIVKFTLIDYPKHRACSIFFQGCNFRCGFCHNPELVERGLGTLSEEEVLEFLKNRRKWLNGVVLLGGEPTIQDDIVEFAEKVKKIGYDIKLDTNGSNPKVIEELIEKKLVDYIAMDVKAPLDKYSEIVGVNVDVKKIIRSIEIIKNSGIEHEFRTTVIPTLRKEDILKIAEIVKPSPYYLQQFKNEKTLRDEYKRLNPYPREFLEEIAKEISARVR